MKLGQPDTTPTPLVEDLPPRDVDKKPNNYRCANCGERGHNARSNTCGMTRAERNEAARQRKIAAAKKAKQG